MRLILIISLSLVMLTGTTQPQANFGRMYTDSFPEKYKITVEKLKKHIYSGIPDKYKNEEFKRKTYCFADQNAFFISNLISNGNVYSDWQEFEDYINAVLKKVIPKELEKDTVIHAYLTKQGSFNAFMTAGGYTFVNIGLFGYINDEASLAAVLAHELAHYSRHHSLETFIGKETGKFSTGFFNSEKKQLKFSVAHEQEADSLAIIWLHNSGYNISGILDVFKIFQRMEKKKIRMMDDKWKLEESTHPLSEKRMERMNEFYVKHKDDAGEKFIIDQKKFARFKEESKPEILKIMLYDFDYYNCIETAFKFHILDPENKIYVYYLMESIRRQCYLNNEIWLENFITNRYYEEQKEDGMMGKTKTTSHLFEKFDTGIMALSPQETNKIQARFYWQDKPKFRTYEDAFEFFYRVGGALNCRECILSNALSQTKKKTFRDSLLTEYLTYDTIFQREFAQRLLDDSILKGMQNKKLLVFNNFYAYVSQGKEKIPVRIQDESETEALIALFDSVTNKFPDRTPVFLPNLKYKGMNDFMMFKELSKFSFHPLISKGERAELHILDPRYLKLFYRYNVNEIEFLNCTYGEYRNSEKSIDEYDEVAEMDYQSIFSQQKRTRYFEVYIYTVRENEKGHMKIRYYGGENKLDFKEQGGTEIISEIKRQIRKKDEIKEEQLNYYLMKKNGLLMK